MNLMQGLNVYLEISPKSFPQTLWFCLRRIRAKLGSSGLSLRTAQLCKQKCPDMSPAGDQEAFGLQNLMALFLEALL